VSAASRPGEQRAPASAPRLLVVEDRDSLRRLLARVFDEEGYVVDAVSTAADALARLASAGASRYTLVLTDLKLPDGSGLEVVRACAGAAPPVPVVVMTAYGTVAAAVEAMRDGALDFLEKPVALDELRERIAAIVAPPPPPAAESAVADSAPPAWSKAGAPPIVGRHPRLRAALHLIERVAASPTTVLLLGESGTGKELFARALHQLSGRRGAFVAVNCAAIPEALVENELFGHEKGAFTGAGRREAGRFEAAQGGTLLLDEIGELPLAAQAKLLRAIEDRSIERIGSGRATPLRVDVRVVAATNQPLQRMVETGRFRRDLFFRLDVFPIELVPLRERSSDVPLLARHLLATIAARAGGGPGRSGGWTLADDAARWLAAQEWPGNVRELANLLERAALFHPAEGPTARTLRASDLEPLLRHWAGPAGDDGERERLRAALAAAGGDKQRAATLLGMSYRTLQRRIVALDLEGFPRYRV
jgi:DNA-binding NtrC family response regulator